MDKAVLIAAIALVALIMRFPDQYRRGMARLCSVEEERLPAFRREFGIAMLIFLGCLLLSSLID
jgi:hypothetical protein